LQAALPGVGVVEEPWGYVIIMAGQTGFFCDIRLIHPKMAHFVVRRVQSCYIFCLTAD